MIVAAQIYGRIRRYWGHTKVQGVPRSAALGAHVELELESKLDGMEAMV